MKDKKQIKIHNYQLYPEYEGMIGTILEDNIHYYTVKMSDGKIIYPYKPNAISPQCEFVDDFVLPEKWCIADKPEYRDIAKRFF